MGPFIFVLPDLDSNQDKQNQNLMCYRYTIGQCDANLYNYQVLTSVYVIIYKSFQQEIDFDCILEENIDVYEYDTS